MEYQMVNGVRVPIPQLIIDADQQAAYVAADDAGRSTLLGPLQTAEAERIASIDDGDTPLVVVED